MLRLAWTGQPAALPAPVGGNVTLATASFAAMNLRVVGDAGPGDPRTLVDHVAIAWSAGAQPPPIAFPSAPLGKYSRVVFSLDGEDQVSQATAAASYTLTGTVAIQGAAAVPFRVTDDTEISVAFDVDAELVVNADATVEVAVDLAKIVGAVDFKTLPVVDGVRVLASDDPQADAVRAKLVDAFHAR